MTIGEALPNYGLLVIEVIDPDSIVNGVVPPLKILPFGETGELCITGPGVAAGYLGRNVLVVELRRPVVIEGQWADVAAKTPTDEEDLFDLMDAYARERGW